MAFQACGRLLRIPFVLGKEQAFVVEKRSILSITSHTPCFFLFWEQDISYSLYTYFLEKFLIIYYFYIIFILLWIYILYIIIGRPEGTILYIIIDIIIQNL